jgi:SAM-dependent methyltransferase
MTDWNERYQKGDTPWEKGAAAPPLLELLEKYGTDFFGTGTVLVPGCGTGHDVRALARIGLDVLGVDLAGEALMRAAGYGKSGSERYEKTDFLHPQWRPGKSFSAIWEHTCYCAIDPSRRPDYAESCAELVEPGGNLVGVFFLTPNGSGEENQGPPFNASIEELDERFSPWFERTHAWVPERAYPGREGDEWLAIYRRK